MMTFSKPFWSPFLSGAILLLMGACSQTPSAPAETAQKDGLICTYEAQTGTRIKTQVCVTPEEARKRAETSQDAIRDVQRRGAGLRID